MAKRKTNRRDGHVRLYWWLLSSPAYRSLCIGSRALLVELYALHTGNNNGALFLSVRKAAEKLNVAPNTAAKWFAELEDRGFIRAKERGTFKLKIRHATQWVLTEHDYGNQPGSRDFMRWSPPAEIQKPVSNFATDSIKFCDRQPAVSKFDTVTVAKSNTVVSLEAVPRSQNLRHR